MVSQFFKYDETGFHNNNINNNNHNNENDDFVLDFHEVSVKEALPLLC